MNAPADAQPTALDWLGSITPPFVDRYRAILHHMPQAFCLIEMLFDPHGTAVDYRFLEINAAFELQTTLNNPVGRTMRELAPQHEAYWFHVYGDVARTGQATHFEQRAQYIGNYWYEVHALPSGPVGSHQVAIFFTDITARKQAEVTLLATQARRAFLGQFNDHLRTLTGKEEVQAVAAQLLGEYLQANQVHYGETQGEYMLIRQGYGNGIPPLVGSFRVLDFGEHLTASHRAGIVQVVADIETAAGSTEADRVRLRQAHIGAYITVPLLKAGEWVATLAVHSILPRQWTTQEVNVVEEVAARTWAAVERAHAEELLRQSEAQLRLFVLASSDSVYKMSADWQQMLHLAGKRFLADTAAPRAPWLNTHIPPTDQAVVGATIQAAIAGGHFFELEHRVIWADGSVGWTFSRAVPVFGPQGELVEWFGTATDITARKRAEQALLDSEAQFRAVANLVPDLLWRSDTQSDTTWYNQRWLDYTGQTLAEAAGYGWAAAIHPDDRPESARRYREAVRTGQPLHQEHRIRSAAGKYRWFQVQALPFRDEQGRITQWFGAATDIHERTQVTQQQQVVAVLEGQEEERRRIAESLHNGLGQVLYATKLQLDQLAPRADEPARQQAKALLSEAIQQARIISHELTPALLTDFGLTIALETICRELRSATLQWHCHLEVADAASLPVALQQAVYRLAQGLAHNVAKHAQASQATLEVEALPGWLVLRLEDNGRGFNPATVREGLGLKTLRSRVALLGGTLEVDSALGQGTQIAVRLPVT